MQFPAILEDLLCFGCCSRMSKMSPTYDIATSNILADVCCCGSHQI